MYEDKGVQEARNCARVESCTRVGVRAVDTWLVSVSSYLLARSKLGGLAPSSVGSV